MKCGNDCKPRKTIFGWTFYYCPECKEWKFRSGVCAYEYHTIKQSEDYLERRIITAMRYNDWDIYCGSEQKSIDSWNAFVKKWDSEHVQYGIYSKEKLGGEKNYER